jgi:hypothetical protein
MASAAPAFAQVATGAGAYDPQGVDIDAQGVFRSKTNDPDPRLAELYKNAKTLKNDGKLLYISLPRLFAQAKALLDEGKPLTDEIKYLGGMVKLQYVFVYPEEKDVVIAGPAEPFDSKVPFRPLGLITGRPVIHFDDVVVALRTFAGAAKPDRVGCDIQVTKEVADRISKKINEVGAAPGGFKKAAEAIGEAGGPQPVKFYGVDPETRYAFVCVEADYRLKQLALGLYKTPVSKVQSYKSLISEPEKAHRFSLESDYQALGVSPNGNAFHLKGASIKVNAGLLGKPDSTDKDISYAAKRFKELCNENLDALLKSVVSWTDLANLGDLAVLASIVHGDKLAERAGWDFAWFLDPTSYAVVKMTAPKSAASLCNYTSAGKMVIYVSGGVWIKPAEWAEKRVKDETFEGTGLRPERGSWRIEKK